VAIGPIPADHRPPDPPSDPPSDPPEPPPGPAPAPGRLPPRVWILLALGALMVVLGPRTCARRAAHAPGSREAPHASTRQEIRQILQAGLGAFAIADTAGAESTWAEVQAFYAARGDNPAWSGRTPHRRAEQLVTAIGRIGEAGLDPREYDLEELDRLFAAARQGGPLGWLNRERDLARFDVRATYDYLRVAQHLRDGRVPRGRLDPDWTPVARERDGAAYLRRWLGHDPGQSLAELEPRHDGYRALRGALNRWRAIALSGGLPVIPPGPPLKAGDRGPRVAALVRRLAATGDLRGAVKDTLFDRRIEQIVGDLQTRHGIPRSGILGEATRVVLNVTAEERIRQMELNLERWRWLPPELGDRRIDVNIPAYRLELVRDGRPVRAMRVVVGKRKSPTPIFSDAIVYIDVNPTWTLPPSVVSKEIWPAFRKNPGYLFANGMTVISIADARRDTVDPATVPWKLAETDSFMFLVIQQAGPENPLGRVKLMCPNEYDVYLHDSPARSRFSVAVRDYSHGCVRVEEAVELADSLVRGGAPDDTTMRVDSMVTAGAWRRLRLPEPVPVHFVYWTAWVDEGGRLNFRDDIYGLDQRLAEALRARTTASLDLNPGVALSPFWVAAEARAREIATRAAAASGRRR
jgi:murein L,D-transpeptidase YcbB/YkuD